MTLGLIRNKERKCPRRRGNQEVRGQGVERIFSVDLNIPKNSSIIQSESNLGVKNFKD
jgi:hypothetical protein